MNINGRIHGRDRRSQGRYYEPYSYVPRKGWNYAPTSGAFLFRRKSMKKLTTLFAAVGVLAALSSPAFAAVEDMALMKTSHAPTGAMGMTTTSASLTDVVVAGIDPATDMITLRHGELKNVGMSAMTMAFKAKDAAMLKEVKDGDNVKVRVENVNGTLTIVKLAKQ
jgi:Cu(I)/Ag(I) efflux system protein CusF